MRHEVWAARLSSVWDVGVIVLGSDRQIDFANARARVLLRVTSDAELDRRWADVAPLLHGVLRTPASDAPPMEATVSLGEGGQRQQLRIQIHDIAEPDGVGYLLIVQHAERADAIQIALRHATQDRGLSSLSRYLAHDLKGLLNVIAMNVEILSRVADGVPEQASDRAAIATRSAAVARRELGRLDRSLEGLLNRDGIEEAAPRAFDVRTVCRNIGDLVAARARHQNVTLTLLMPDQPADVVGFPDRLHAAVLNLIVNAFDAMPNGGNLSLEVTRMPQEVRVIVRDTGPGVEAGAAEDIWHLYYTTKPGGTGIGLYVTRAVAESHGGRVRLDPNPEGGACFTIELPAAPAV